MEREINDMLQVGILNAVGLSGLQAAINSFLEVKRNIIVKDVRIMLDHDKDRYIGIILYAY